LVRNLFGAALSDAVARWKAGGLMNAMTTLIFLLVATGQQSAEGTRNEQAAKAKSQRLLELHTDDAASYESSDPDVVDGALFTMVSSAGTDPEIILMLEARKSESGSQWVFGAARFSDMNLWLNHKNKEVWSSIRSEENTFYHDAKHTFRFYQDRFIPEIRESDTTTTK
jgi:hypothetical protein